MAVYIKLKTYSGTKLSYLNASPIASHIFVRHRYQYIMYPLPKLKLSFLEPKIKSIHLGKILYVAIILNPRFRRKTPPSASQLNASSHIDWDKLLSSYYLRSSWSNHELNRLFSRWAISVFLRYKCTLQISLYAGILRMVLNTDALLGWLITSGLSYEEKVAFVWATRASFNDKIITKSICVFWHANWLITMGFLVRKLFYEASVSFDNRG